MVKSAAVVALSFAGAAFAQSAGIPTGLSASCNTFFTTLNNDATINNCLTSLVDATSDFNPLNPEQASPTAVSSTLNSICSSSFQSCPQSNIRDMLARFWTACSTDMLGTAGDGSNGNKDVVSIYDVLYLLVPLKNALCTKDGDQYCVNAISGGSAPSPSEPSSAEAPTANTEPEADTEPEANTEPEADTNPEADTEEVASSSAPDQSVSSASSSSSVSESSSASASAPSPSATNAKRTINSPSLYKRTSAVVPRQEVNNTTDQTTLGTVAPEAETYNQLGLPYLFITPNLTAEQLCTPCTSNVVGAYINWETVTPYALGIYNSPMLSGQVALWEKIKECPNNFAREILTNSMGSINSSGSGALANVRVGAHVFVAAAAAVFGGVVLF